ncbi:Aste57867_14445 [Aphanomyces stellatus]|uniref:Aste57867_14445 protein n=1 Tax=Aphanomyces stellatus TaxID=120398 RepID=A0A485L105_9STRA|nr:hypothetical protein As57867_014391 [Aphanomyces stellatus]VFT91267.1 Aste57867_14445 [Aphanomyces stellatus]
MAKRLRFLQESSSTTTTVAVVVATAVAILVVVVVTCVRRKRHQHAVKDPEPTTPTAAYEERRTDDTAAESMTFPHSSLPPIQSPVVMPSIRASSVSSPPPLHPMESISDHSISVFIDPRRQIQTQGSGAQWSSDEDSYVGNGVWMTGMTSNYSILSDRSSKFSVHDNVSMLSHDNTSSHGVDVFDSFAQSYSDHFSPLHDEGNPSAKF